MEQSTAALYPPAPATEYALLAASGIRWLLCRIGIVSPVDSFPIPPVLLLLFTTRSITYFASFAAPPQQKTSVYWSFVVACYVVWLGDLLRMRCSIPWFIAGGAYFVYELAGRRVMVLLCGLDLLGLRILTLAQTVTLTYAVFVYFILYVSVSFLFGIALATAILNPAILESIQAQMQQSSHPIV